MPSKSGKLKRSVEMLSFTLPFFANLISPLEEVDVNYNEIPSIVESIIPLPHSPLINFPMECQNRKCSRRLEAKKCALTSSHNYMQR